MHRPAIADYPRGARMAPRTIDDFELVWMLRGQARLVLADRELTLTPGRLLLVPPGVEHAFVWDERRSCRHGYLHFRPEEVGVRLAREIRCRAMTRHDPLAGLCAHLLWLAREPAGDWAGATRRGLRFLLSLLTAGPLPEDRPDPAPHAPLRTVLTFLRAEWSGLPLRRAVSPSWPPPRVCRAATSAASSARSSASASPRAWSCSVAPARSCC